MTVEEARNPAKRRSNIFGCAILRSSKDRQIRNILLGVVTSISDQYELLITKHTI
jgi:hypothetical protein